MQRIHRALPLPVRGGQPTRRRQSSTRCSVRTAAPAGVATLAPGFVQALPELRTVPTAYSHELRADLLYDLCAAFVRERVAGPDLWRRCEGSSVVFAQRAIMERIGEKRWNLLKDNVEYHLSVSDVAERDGYDVLLGKGRLAVTIECGGAGYFKIGPAIAALEAEATGLGAAFYWTLTYALYRVMRIYNHDDAFQYEERMREYAEDDEENREQYEFPDVEKALPECIQRTLKCDDHRRYRRDTRCLLAEHRKGQFARWIEHVEKIDRLARLRMPSDSCFREEGGYDSIPLPCLIVAFNDHDAVVACFDEESNYMLEGSSEPTVGVVFSPDKPEEVRNAIRAVERFIEINLELFELVEEVKKWEKRHAGTDLDRGEPSLRTEPGAPDLQVPVAELRDAA
jgi:hypothetical protein